MQVSAGMSTEQRDMDFTKAFDKVPHVGKWVSLKQTGRPKQRGQGPEERRDRRVSLKPDRNQTATLFLGEGEANISYCTQSGLNHI